MKGASTPREFIFFSFCLFNSQIRHVPYNCPPRLVNGVSMLRGNTTSAGDGGGRLARCYNNNGKSSLKRLFTNQGKTNRYFQRSITHRTTRDQLRGRFFLLGDGFSRQYYLPEQIPILTCTYLHEQRKFEAQKKAAEISLFG